jgi:hypothetical protein
MAAHQDLLHIDHQKLTNPEKIKLYFELETAIESALESSEYAAQLTERKKEIKLQPRKGGKGLVSFVFSVVRFVSAVLFLLICAFLLFIPLVTVVPVLDQMLAAVLGKRRVLYNLFRAFNAGGFLWMLGIKVTGIFDMEKPPANSHVLFFTHGSNLDAFMFLASYPFDFNSVGKDDLFKIPFVGWLGYVHGLLPINRKHRSIHCF